MNITPNTSAPRTTDPGDCRRHHPTSRASVRPDPVPAGVDGAAQVSLTPDTTQNDLDVSVVYGDGHTSASVDHSFFAVSFAPFCEDGPPVGQESPCLLFPDQPDAVLLTYSFDGAAPVTVPTFDGGIVTITLTEPDHAAVLTMTTNDSNGIRSDPSTIDVTGAGSSGAASAARPAQAASGG